MLAVFDTLGSKKPGLVAGGNNCLPLVGGIPFFGNGAFGAVAEQIVGAEDLECTLRHRNDGRVGQAERQLGKRTMDGGRLGLLMDAGDFGGDFTEIGHEFPRVYIFADVTRNCRAH